MGTINSGIILVIVPIIHLLCMDGGIRAAAAEISSLSSIIDPDLFLINNKAQTVVISFGSGMESVIESIDRRNYSSLAEKRTALTNAQQTFSFQAQRHLQMALRSLRIQFDSFWINNKVVVPSANLSLIQTMARISGVSRIEKEPIVKLLPIHIEGNTTYDGADVETRQQQQSRPVPPPLLWHIRNIGAHRVWKESFTGDGVVIASIDSGVRYTHESLIHGWRKNYGWYDPFQRTETPNDQLGHGTHTAGTVSGKNGIGVAPDSTWIACKGCSSSGCGITQLYACGQWVQCPTLPNGSRKDCSYAPDIVTNSWAGTRGDWYDDIIRSWKSAEIIGVFGIGNSGPNCGTASSPGDRNNVIGVGSTNHEGKLSVFSSVGPSSDSSASIKPDICAPGEHVLSAWNSGDKDYASSQGTSMATPSVSGVIALMKHKRPSLTYEQAYKAITGTAERGNGIDTSTARTCGGTSPNTFPNNAFGYGRIDAQKAFNAI